MKIEKYNNSKASTPKVTHYIVNTRTHTHTDFVGKNGEEGKKLLLVGLNDWQSRYKWKSVLSCIGDTLETNEHKQKM